MSSCPSLCIHFQPSWPPYRHNTSVVRQLATGQNARHFEINIVQIAGAEALARPAKTKRQFRLRSSVLVRGGPCGCSHSLISIWFFWR